MMIKTVHVSGIDMPELMIVGFAVTLLGGLGGVYVAFRAKGWRGFLPFNPFGTQKSALRIYFEHVRENNWSKFPVYLWFIVQPAGVVMAIIGFLQLIRR